ncbi:hypothetical protein ACWF9G_02250 [Nocardia sp. NPDC055029]
MSTNDEMFPSRRALLRVAAGVGIAALTLPLMVENAAPASATQRLWKRCSRCSGLWYTGNGTRGGCPAGDIFDGGHHDDGTGDYILKEDPDGGQGQSGWRWCRRCQGLWFETTPGQFAGVCPSPDIVSQHVNFGSGHYRLEDEGNRDGAGGQAKWRWCRKCSGLFYDGFSPAASGVCPADKQHHDIIGSGSYVLRSADSTRLPRPPY